jgi:hypothetical protein
MDRTSIYSKFQRLAPRRHVRRLSEDSRKEGVVIDLLVDDLRINCNWNYMDLTVAVTTAIDADGWTPGWAGVCYLVAFIERKNDSSAIEEILNSPRQITWLIDNFDEVYALMLDPSLAGQKHAFFEFQASKFKGRSEKAVSAFKQGRSAGRAD